MSEADQELIFRKQELIVNRYWSVLDFTKNRRSRIPYFVITLNFAVILVSLSNHFNINNNAKFLISAIPIVITIYATYRLKILEDTYNRVIDKLKYILWKMDIRGNENFSDEEIITYVPGIWRAHYIFIFIVGFVSFTILLFQVQIGPHN